MSSVVRLIKMSAANKTVLFLSTPNLNFLANNQSDPDFRETLLLSDLCLPDGISIVLLAKLIGIPIKTRVAGSDLFDALKTEISHADPLKVFLFGGPDGVALAAAQELNSQSCGLRCVGSLYPGFGSVDDMSGDNIVDIINSSGADVFVASLGAKKGQMWLLRNHRRLRIPIRTHLGASLNFQAGTVRRSPVIMRRLGLEWLWRIKEEPYLWRRYWGDGRVLLILLLTKVVPLVISMFRLRLRSRSLGDLIVTKFDENKFVTVALSGSATSQNVLKAIPAFRECAATNKQVIINFSNVHAIDSRFLGLILMFRKKIKSGGATLAFVGMRPGMRRIFRLNGLGFLLSD